jgi:hypothetical protein
MSAVPDWVVSPEPESKGPSRATGRKLEIPEALSVKEVRELNVAPSEMLIEAMVPKPGASLLVSPPKCGKTILGVHMAIAVSEKEPLFDFYRAMQGPAMIVEQDDPSGPAGIRDIIVRAGVSDDAPLFVQPRLPFNIGPAFLDWLRGQILRRGLKFVLLDSYTALRGPRGAGIDIVKAEQNEMLQLDTLAKETDCAFLLVHHSSKGSAALDWSDRAAGTFAMSAATEAQIHISRFADLPGAAPERLVRVRGRHCADLELVLKFRPENLDYEHVLEGGSAPLYPLLLQIQTAFQNRPFGPKELCHETGVSRTTAHRQIERLFRAGALTKRGFGEYVLGDLR